MGVDLSSNNGNNNNRGSRNGHSEMKLEATINLTPFVDIMMVLLIIFMITAPLMQYGMDVNLPQAKATVLEKTDKDIVLTVKPDGTIYLADDKTPVTVGFLETKLATIFENKEKKDLYINADENVIYGKVVEIMSVAKSAGVGRIGMVTRPIKESKESSKEN